MDEDLMPNDGSYFQVTEPDDQALERRVEASKAQAAKPMLEDLIRRTTDRITDLSSNDSITIDPMTAPDEFMRAWYGVQERLAENRDMLNHLESLLLTTRA